MRQPFVLLLLCAALLVAAVTVGARSAPHAMADEAADSAFLPLLGRGMRRAELSTPVAVPPTPTKPATPIPTATVVVPPTQTALPSPTATAVNAGFIRGRLTQNGQPLAYGLGDGIGPGLFLQRCRAEGEDCAVIGRTGVVADGRYEFRVPEGLGEEEYYQVVWWNENGTFGDFLVDGADLWLGAWHSPEITEYEPGDEVTIADMELANIALTGPSHGSGYGGFPWPFTWEPWVGTGEAKYRWSICDCCGNLEQRRGAYRSRPVEDPVYELTGLPPGIRFNQEYCWFVEVDAGEERGLGESYHVWMLWFIPVLVENFEVVSPTRWLAP